MKLFSELGSCYRPSTASASRSPDQEEYSTIRVTSPLPSGRRHAKRMNKLGGGSAASSATRNWRPVLHAIREDGVVLGSDSEGKNKITEKRAHTNTHSENKCRGRYTPKPHRVSHNDDYYYSRKNNSEPMIIPAFSPTPFMF